MPPALVGARRSLPGDAMAGLTLAAIALPGSMGTAQLVGAPAIAGLVAFIVGSVVFALLGGHRTLSVGADSSIAPMLAAAAAGGAITGSATVGELTPAGHPVIHAETLMLTSVLVGAILLIVGVFRGGWITQFLSRPVTIGLLAGIGLDIIVDQLPVAMGLPRHGGGAISGVVEMLTSLGEINWLTVSVAGLVLFFTLGARMIGPRVPGALVGIAAAMAYSAAADLGGRGVVTVPRPNLAPPNLDFASVTPSAAMALLPTALVISILIVIQTGATEASFPGERRTLDRDLGTIGVASAIAGALGSFAVNASPPRTAVVTAAKGKSQVAGLVAAAIVAAAGFLGAGLIPLLPTAALAAVLLTVAARLIKVRSMSRIARFSRIEFAVCLATVVLVAFVGVVQGVLIAALVTLLDRTRREARPPTHRKGMIPKSNHWVPVDAGTPTVQVPGVLVWSVEASLWYADSEFVVDQLKEELDGDEGPYAAVVLDAAAIADVDFTGAGALTSIIDHLEAEMLPLIIARPNRSVQGAIRKAGLAEHVLTEPTVGDAVKHATRLVGLGDELRAVRGKRKDLAALKDKGVTPDEVIERAEEQLEE
ncbi:SulP family inorganic anion transporter [Corynebacterium hansenii]|uniref:SulP family inorganic anion transporter n=1 Tax=Corynebacterium hansenii TaxID=394964 RepID=A0ABV7ZQF9_9CORY|nr:SulP family inorganic anion transporter [Corynebacterium hansenii]WJY98680.1 putative sulfate transporter [Corynebacterium hansenii]